ncbi:hypothetical protein SADUNF_Sadunf15G0100900 [Salix dunnii]|uniref:Uncharacterized protein n=1 Tax=Salix dunnii TaxID=1413687 RepID=A0A835MIW2_9ROSI|nr:hypothetical protein SADUNF_Sadunf15G0100900 [Salix dunnii]
METNSGNYEGMQRHVIGLALPPVVAVKIPKPCHFDKRKGSTERWRRNRDTTTRGSEARTMDIAVKAGYGEESKDFAIQISAFKLYKSI